MDIIKTIKVESDDVVVYYKDTTCMTPKKCSEECVRTLKLLKETFPNNKVIVLSVVGREEDTIFPSASFKFKFWTYPLYMIKSWIRIIKS